MSIRPASALLETVGAPQPFILEPLLAPGIAALIYGPAGAGKSFLALGLALAAAGGGSFLGWTARRSHNVLYLDGEMSRQAVAGRLRLFGSPPPSLRMWLAAEHEGPRLDLSTLDGLLWLTRSWGDVDLVIIDSLSSLAGGVLQQDTERWHEMRYFLDLQQRSRRAVVMVHHANRDGAMRGISRRADAMDVIMALRRPRDWQSTDGARFELRLEKTRHRSGAGLVPIEAQLCTGPDGRAQWHWHSGGSAALRRALPLLQQGMSAEAVGKAIGVSARTAYRLQRRARELGRVLRTSGYGSKG
ncbi:MAG: AAA family ATPase [Proteobacteria bacterium]|nr:AAA family ATPase [Pseudomonadota bacterium]